MLRSHPAHASDIKIPDNQRFKDWLRTLVKKVESDWDAASSWREERRTDYRLRYAQEWRNVSWPWVGASDFVSPMIDMQIERVKSQYSDLVTKVHPPVTALAADAESQMKAPFVERWFDYQVLAGSPGFISEEILFTDDICQIGRGTLKSYWNFETRTLPITLLKERLPERLREMVVEVKRITPGALSGAVTTSRQFDMLKSVIRQMVAIDLNLQPDDPTDQNAIEEIMKWLRDGAEDPLTVKTRDIVIDAPCVSAVSGFDLILPPETTEIEDAERITHRMFMSERQIRTRSGDAYWNKTNVKKYLDTRQKPKKASSRFTDMIRSEMASREGIYDYDRDDQYEIYEICAWYSQREGAREEKVVVLVSPNAPEMALKAYPYVRPSGNWPYHTCPFEWNERRWYAPRGIPAKLRDINKDHTMFHRMKQNIMMIASAPTFLGRLNSLMNWKTQRWIPGQIIWTSDPARDLREIQVNTNINALSQEQAELRATGEAYIGIPDYANQNALSSLNNPRTATEIQAIQGQSNQALSLRGTLFQLCMSSVYREMFDLFQTYGDNKVWIQVTGDAPLELSKEDLQGQYVFRNTGTIGQSDPVLEAQKALARLQMIMQLKAAPQILGDEWDADAGAAMLDWLMKDDPRAANVVFRRRSDEEIQALRQERAQQANLQGAMMGAQMGQQLTQPPGRSSQGLTGLMGGQAA